MKIKFWDRLILLIGALVTVASSVALFWQGLQVNNVLFIICAVLLAAFGGYLAMLPRRYYAKRNDFVIQRTESGELRIAVKAIENQVQKCIDLHEEIQVNTMNILTTREGVVVDLTVTLANNISIPLAVASLQKQIKQYLIASSGIEVKEVRVSVESTQNSLAAEAPASEGDSAEKAAVKDAKEKKAPLHQRLFGRPDEPAIVPEPPKEEEIGEDEEAATEAETEEAVEVEEAKEQPAPIPEEPAEEPLADAPAEEDADDAPADETPALQDAAPETPETAEAPETVTAPETEEEEPEDQPKPRPESEIIPESEEQTHE